MTCCTRINIGPVSNPKLCTAEGVVFIKGVVASELAVYSLNVVVDGRLQEPVRDELRRGQWDRFLPAPCVR